MTARQQRRRAEHKARKEANKAARQTASANLAHPNDQPSEAQDFSPEPDAPTRTRAEINRQNAQHSTGPRTEEGKATSSLNNFRHGLAGRFVVLGWENADIYYELLHGLRLEHQPETTTEHLLVERMAQHQWLSQRAVFLQDMCFHMKVPMCEQEKQLALYLRYATTHDRAFHKCLSDLLKLRAAKRKEAAGFESQKRQQAAETRKQELHEAKLSALKAKSEQQNRPAAPHGREIPAPVSLRPSAATVNSAAIHPDTEESRLVLQATPVAQAA
ncbi:MAG TPA: hypothetical protein VLJ11_19810 [Bryobacteraceae bacterium]|nr:hypothetical protein [Bryobacteraceae bacterium]